MWVLTRDSDGSVAFWESLTGVRCAIQNCAPIYIIY